jgi:hypothetical protein
MFGESHNIYIQRVEAINCTASWAFEKYGAVRNVPPVFRSVGFVSSFRY